MTRERQKEKKKGKENHLVEERERGENEGARKLLFLLKQLQRRRKQTKKIGSFGCKLNISLGNTGRPNRNWVKLC